MYLSPHNPLPRSAAFDVLLGSPCEDHMYKHDPETERMVIDTHMNMRAL